MPLEYIPVVDPIVLEPLSLKQILEDALKIAVVWPVLEP
jgi:hypothetical protein